MAHLLKFDSMLGPLDGRRVASRTACSAAAGHEIQLLVERDPANMPWGELGVDVVLESTGFFTKREGAQKHLDAGAKKVVISAPATDPDITLVLGVNDDQLRPRRAPHHLERLVHDQLPRADREGAERRVRDRARLHDDDPRLHGRPAAPGHAARRPAARPRGRDQPDPDLDRRRQGDRPRAARARRASSTASPSARPCRPARSPISSRSSVGDVDRRRGQRGLRGGGVERPAAAATSSTRPTPLVSTDIDQSPYSCIFDSKLTMAGGNLVKVFGWYDNEWGYSCRLVDLVNKLAG